MNLQKKNIGTSSTGDESTKRKKLGEKIVKEFTSLLNAGIKTTSGKDESIKVDFSSIYEHNRKTSRDLTTSINGWIVNIVSVRTAYVKRRIRDHGYTEYIIQSGSREPIFVVRRHKDFKKLYIKLKAEFAAIDIPPIPNKIKGASSIFNKSHKSQKMSDNNYSSNDLYQLEKNRQNLRAYLHSLLSIRKVARSKTMRLFLTDSPITLNENEKRDVLERQKLDSLRDEQRKRFNEEAEKHTKELEQYVSEFKEDVTSVGGLSKVIDTIKKTPNISGLPKTYQKIIEWGEIGFASTLYSLFIGSDNSNVTFAQLKRTHSLMPYKTIRTIMKISNPVALIRGILDLFLAQPFGQKSLAQRILSMNLTEDLKELNKDIKILEEEINEDGVCAKIRNFIYASSKIQATVKNGINEEDTDALILAILRTKALTPNLNDLQIARFTGVINGFKIDSTALLFNLKKLFFFYARQRDKEMLIDLLFQGITGELIKEIITIFYEPLAKVYKSADISGSLSDLSAFVDDLINVVEEADRKGIIMHSPAESVVQIFVSLVQRHMPKFYSFIHSVYSSDSSGLFNSLLGWIESLFDFMRSGLTDPIDLQQLVNMVLTTEERTLYVTELDNLINWHTWRKKRHLMNLKNIMYNDINGNNSDNGSEDEDYTDDDDFVEIDEDFERKMNNHEGDDDDSQYSTSDSDSIMDINKKMEFPELKIIPKLLSPFVNLISSSMRNINIK